MNAPEEIYVVFGETGEYDDRHYWPVAAYYDKNEAERHAQTATRWMGVSKARRDQQSLARTNPYDVHCNVDPITGTKYTVAVVPLVAHPDEYMERFPK